MRRLSRFALHTALPAALLFTSVGCGGKLKRLSSQERDHYYALRVFMEEDQEKQFLKNKTQEERDAYLREQRLWDRFYQHDEATREAIVGGQVRTGWTDEQVFMAWGPPHDRKHLTGRPATRSELFRYRFEVTPEGEVLVWEDGSKETYRAVDRFEVDVYIDDHRVSELDKRDSWTQ